MVEERAGETPWEESSEEPTPSCSKAGTGLSLMQVRWSEAARYRGVKKWHGGVLAPSQPRLGSVVRDQADLGVSRQRGEGQERCSPSPMQAPQPGHGPSGGPNRRVRGHPRVLGAQESGSQGGSPRTSDFSDAVSQRRVLTVYTRRWDVRPSGRP